MNDIKYKKIVMLDDYDCFNGYAYMYKSLNDFIMDYKKYYVNNHQKTIGEKLIDIKQNSIIEKSVVYAKWYDDVYKYNVVLIELTFNDVFKHFITWCLYDLKIGKNDNITLIKYDDYIVIYTVNNKYEYYFTN